MPLSLFIVPPLLFPMLDGRLLGLQSPDGHGLQLLLAQALLDRNARGCVNPLC